MIWAAVEEPGGSGFSDPLTWINFGVLGLVVLGLLTGWIWSKPATERMIQERDRLIEERDKAWAQRDAAAAVMQEKLIPVTAELLVAMKALLPLLDRLQSMEPVMRDYVYKRERSERNLRGGDDER